VCVLYSVERHSVCNTQCIEAQSRGALCVCSARCRGSLCVYFTVVEGICVCTAQCREALCVYCTV